MAGREIRQRVKGCMKGMVEISIPRQITALSQAGSSLQALALPGGDLIPQELELLDPH